MHGAAAGSHAADRQLSVLFAIAALAQTAWAAWALGPKAGRTAAVTGILLHGFTLGVLVVAWTTGVGLIDGLAEKQDPGLQDGVTAALEGIALLTAIALTIRPRFAPPRRAVLPALAAAVLLVAAVPAMAAPHEPSGGADDHQSEEGVAGQAQQNSEGHGAGHATPSDPGEQPVVADEIELPDVPGVTAEQQERARDLIRRTRAGLARFADPAAAEAAGFRSIGDGFTGFEHYVHYGFLANPTILDGNEPESIVYKVAPDGSRELVSAMYILPPGTTMDSVPEVAGAMTPWHDHKNLCWAPDGRVVGVVVNGTCRPAGVNRVTPPMLHVWVTEHVCGPFAGIEGGSTPERQEDCPTHH